MNHYVIEFNSNQLNLFSYKNKSHQKSTNFNSQFTEKVKRSHHVNKHSSEQTSSQQTVIQPLSSFVTQENRSSGSQYFKQQLSLMAKFAIKQYETFANIERQQTNESILGVNEYA